MKKTEFDSYVDEMNLQPEATDSHPSVWPEPDDVEIGEELKLSDRTLPHPVEVDQYLFALATALSVVEDRLGKPSSYDVAGLFLDYFLSNRCEYDRVAPINPLDKKYPIFAGYVAVDILLALEYEKLRDAEIAADGAPSGNGASALFLQKNSVLYFEDAIPSLFASPEFYADLREKAYAEYKLMRRDKLPNVKTMFTHRLEQIGLQLEKNVSLARNSDPFVQKVYSLVSEEVSEHLNQFSNKKYNDGILPLTDHQRVLLTLNFIRTLGLVALRPVDISRFMESCFGGKAVTYRKIIDKCATRCSSCGYARKEDFEKSLKQIRCVFDLFKGTNGKKIEEYFKQIESDPDALPDVIAR